MKTVLLTGASSAAGARILEVLAARPDVTRVYLLGGGDAARAPAEAAAKEVLPLPGDVKLPRLGLDGKGFEQASAADTIIHCAERTELDQDLPRAREWNVQPVRSLIELLQEARGARLVHLSTTWVAGTKRGLFTEFDLDCRQGFYNAYEQSKHEAECLLRDSAVSGRVTIARRSLALGAPGRLGSILQPLRGRRLLVSGDSRIR
ncbi:MAG TPA: SDR family oxidoreductase, partial [Myxococcales bacterium]|nr:SDR family oxidoreductase [Myxococcales bacterium]